MSVHVGAMAGWLPARFQEIMPAAHLAAAFGAPPGFGASPAPTGNRDLDDALAREVRLEEALVALRSSLVRNGLQLRGLGRTLPDAAVREFNRQRSQGAQAVQVLATGIIEQVRAISTLELPLVGQVNVPFVRGILDRLRSADEWAEAFLDRIPLLPREIVSPSFRSAAAPSLDGGTRGFGAVQIPAAVGVAVAVLLGGIGVYIAARGIAAAFNTKAEVLVAEAERLRAWNEGQLEIINRLAAAGASPEQIVRTLEANKPPAPPDAGWGLPEALTAIGIGLALAAGAYAWTRYRR